MSRRGKRHRRAGFTLIELLVVISIVVLLVSILLPALGAARGQARLVLCSSNQRQLNIAATQYADERKGWFPPIVGNGMAVNWMDANHWGYAFVGWGLRWQNLALTYATEMIPTGKVFFCPAQADELFTYDYYGPWLGPKASAPPAADPIRSSYFFNPRIKNPAAGDAFRAFPKVELLDPRAAFITDLVFKPETFCHGAANEPRVNILFGDGSGRATKGDKILVDNSAASSFNNFDYVTFFSELARLEAQ